MKNGVSMWWLAALMVVASVAVVLPLQADEDGDGERVQNQAELLARPAVAKSLVDACEIVRLINEVKLDEVKLRIDNGDMLMVLEGSSKQQDWHGVGAYRGSEWDAEGNTVKHRFVYGADKNAFHELWLVYDIEGEGFKKPSFGILGW